MSPYLLFSLICFDVITKKQSNSSLIEIVCIYLAYF